MASFEALTPQQKYDLITRNLGEVLGREQLMKLCEEQGRVIKCYWGGCRSSVTSRERSH